MTNAALMGMREMWEMANRTVTHSLTAKQMALTDHKLARGGMHCHTDSGLRYDWNSQTERWECFDEDALRLLPRKEWE